MDQRLQLGGFFACRFELDEDNPSVFDEDAIRHTAIVWADPLEDEPPSPSCDAAHLSFDLGFTHDLLQRLRLPVRLWALFLEQAAVPHLTHFVRQWVAA